MKIVLYIGFIVCSVLPFWSAVEDDEIGVSFISSPEEVNPGGYETYVIEIKNYLTEPVDLETQVELPEGWSVISGPDNFQIDGLKSQKAVYLLSVSDDCLSGKKKILFSFKDEEKSFVKKAEIYPFVKERPKLSLRTLEEVDVVSEDDEVEISYLLVNEGNTSESIKLNSERATIVGDDKFTLAPGESQRIKLVGKTALREGTTRISRKFYDININSTRLPDPIRRTSLVKVIPKQTGKFDPYLRFPIIASAYYVVGQSVGNLDDAFQVELAGKGYLDFAQEKHLSFVFRAPNQFQVTRLGNFDQYSLNYEQERFEVQLGDGNYQISQLLEQGRLARGAAFTVRNAKWEMQVSHSLPRFNPDIDYISTAILSRRINKNWTLGGVAMQKQFTERGYSYVASGRARFESRFVQINTELAGSHWEGSQDWGGSLEMNARHQNLTFGATALYAGPDFAGFFRNSLIVTGNINYRLDKLSFGGGINYNESNPALDTFQIAAPFSRNFFVNTTYELSPRSQLWLFAIQRSREDRFEPKRFHYDERSLRLRYNYKSAGFNSQTNFQFGQTENLLIQEQDNQTLTYSVNTNLGVVVSPRFNINLFGSFLSTNRYSAEKEEIFLYGGGVNYHTPMVKFGITYRNNYLLDDINLDRSILNTNLAFKVGNHEIGGFLGYNIFRNTINERDFYATATYRYTMGLPIAKRKDIGNLKGKIIRSDGSPAAGIILKVGRQTVVTETDGSFVFENLRKGDHFLLADISSLGLKEMFQQKMPFQFTIAPAEQKQIQLNLITAAGLTMPVTYQLGPKVKKPVGLVVRLRNDSEEFVTDLSPQEAFEFLKVNPGLWTYQVVQNGWEQKYSIRPSSGTIELEEGEQLEIPIFVREKELQIKFKN